MLNVAFEVGSRTPLRSLFVDRLQALAAAEIRLFHAAVYRTVKLV